MKWRSSASVPKAAQKHGVGGNATVTMESNMEWKKAHRCLFLPVMIKPARKPLSWRYYPKVNRWDLERRTGSEFGVGQHAFYAEMGGQVVIPARLSANPVGSPSRIR